MKPMANTKNERRWAIISLASVPLIMTLGNSMLIPVLPVMEKKLEISKLQSSYIITCYSIVAIIFIQLAGFLSDRFGRNKVIVLVLFLIGVGRLILWMVFWNMGQGCDMFLLGCIVEGWCVAGEYTSEIG